MLHVKDYRPEYRNILGQLHRVTPGFAINEQIIAALVADEGEVLPVTFVSVRVIV